MLTFVPLGAKNRKVVVKTFNAFRRQFCLKNTGFSENAAA